MPDLHRENGNYIGCSYTETFDPHWNNVVLCVEPSSLDTSYPTDETGRALTFNGNSAVSEDGILLDGSTGYVSVQASSAWTPDTAYTVEFLITPDKSAFYSGFSGGYSNWAIQGRGVYFGGNVDGWGGSISNAYSFQAATTTYIAWTWDGSIARSYQDGLQTGSTPIPTFYDRPDTLWLGALIGTYYFDGTIHAVRITQGVARPITSLVKKTRFFQPRRFPSGAWSL